MKANYQPVRIISLFIINIKGCAMKHDKSIS